MDYIKHKETIIIIADYKKYSEYNDIRNITGDYEKLIFIYGRPLLFLLLSLLTTTTTSKGKIAKAVAENMSECHYRDRWGAHKQILVSLFFFYCLFSRQ